MKVTFCTLDWPSYVGGPNAWLRRLAPELRRRGIQVRVLFLVYGGSPENCPTIIAFHSQGIDCPAVSTPVYIEDRVRWVLKKIREDPPDVFVPNLMLPAYYAGRWVREAGIPSVGVLHSDDTYHHGLVREFVFGDIRYRLSAMVCVSKFIEQEVLRQCPDRVLIRRIPCGVPLPQLIAQSPTGRMKFVYTGRLDEEQKRISDLTHAFCRVVRDVPNTEAVIYGDGPASQTVKLIISEEGKGLPVSFAGRVDSDQIQAHLQTSHVFVLLSDYEGLSISVMEAMASGVVPICLRTRSGSSELIEDGVTGLLVSDRGDDFVNAVRRLRDEPDTWERLSRGARARIEAEYSSEGSATRWEALLGELSEASQIKQLVKIPRHLVLPPIPPEWAPGHMRKPPLLSLITQGAWRLTKKVSRRGTKRYD
jgi:colanic acid/amylovoran biosynthesis glycosyltransferase